jgi:hypothetical protein
MFMGEKLRKTQHIILDVINRYVLEAQIRGMGEGALKIEPLHYTMIHSIL